MKTIMREQLYHKYVYNFEKKQFLGNFEEMYQAEDIEGFDSWYQETENNLHRTISLAILERYNFNRILDIGCGKGTFTNLLKRENNYVMGFDISETAISKAKAKYPNIDFRRMEANNILSLSENHFDLVVCSAVIYYIPNWRNLVKDISAMTQYIYFTVYITRNSMAFVKSFKEMIDEVLKYFVIDTKVVLDNEKLLLLAHLKKE